MKRPKPGEPVFKVTEEEQRYYEEIIRINNDFFRLNSRIKGREWEIIFVGPNTFWCGNYETIINVARRIINREFRKIGLRPELKLTSLTVEQTYGIKRLLIRDGIISFTVESFTNILPNMLPEHFESFMPPKEFYPICQ